MKPTSKEVGALLRELRLEQKRSAQDVQRASGVSSLAYVEIGRASVGDMDRVAHVLGTTLVDMMQHAMYRERTRPVTDLRYLAEAVVNLPDGGSKVDRLIEATVLYALERTGQNQSEAARQLGMERKAFVRRLAKARRAAKAKAKR